jgi:transposase
LENDVKPITIPNDDNILTQLSRFKKKTERDGHLRVTKRIDAIIRNIDGNSAPEIARLLEVNRTTVWRWLRKIQQHGPTGLRESPRPGRPSLLSLQDKLRLKAIIQAGPLAYGFSDKWTWRMIDSVIQEEFRVKYSNGHVRRLVNELGFSSRWQRWVDRL